MYTGKPDITLPNPNPLKPEILAQDPKAYLHATAAASWVHFRFVHLEDYRSFGISFRVEGLGFGDWFRVYG